MGKEYKLIKRYRQGFVFYWHFVSWYEISLGINIDWWLPNIEIHLPFGFFKFGIQGLEDYEEIVL